MDRLGTWKIEDEKVHVESIVLTPSAETNSTKDLASPSDGKKTQVGRKRGAGRHVRGIHKRRKREGSHSGH